MVRRTAKSNIGRRGHLSWTAVRGTLHSWVALTCLIQLYAEGVRRLALTLPVVIIAVLEAWHEFRITSCICDNSSASPDDGENHPKVDL